MQRHEQSVCCSFRFQTLESATRQAFFRRRLQTFHAGGIGFLLPPEPCKRQGALP